MMTIVNDLKHQARHLQRAAAAGDAATLARLRKHHELGDLSSDSAARVQRRHCLAVLAAEHGFSGWGHLTRVVGGATDGDFGTTLHRRECLAHWNIWLASYDEARSIRAEHGGYLLAYRRQFLIVDRHYIETLGLDPDDPDWTAMGRDWVRPADPEARRRLYAKLIAARS